MKQRPKNTRLPSRLACGDGCFDAVLAVYCLEHIPGLDAALGESFRVLKPGGKLVAALPAEGSLYRLGRRLTVARYFGRRLGVNYQALIEQEHVNPYQYVLKLMGSYFSPVRVLGIPWGLPLYELGIWIIIRAGKPLS